MFALRPPSVGFLIAALALSGASPLAETAEEKSAVSSGLVLRLASSAAPQKFLDVRRSRLLALRVPAGSPPSPLMAPGKFVASWRGHINIDLRDYFTFHASGSGRFVLKINDELILSADLVPGQAVKSTESIKLSGIRPNSVEATLQALDPSQPVEVRVQWSTEERPAEPIAPTVLKHDGTDAQLARFRQVRRGRELFGQHQCIRCHRPQAPFNTRSRMPELDTDAPSLLGIGGRLEEDWLAHWIRDPKSIRPTSRMPKLLHGPTSTQQAADIAAYLTSAKDTGGHAPDEQPKQELVDQGAALYHGLGCVACHSSEPPGTDPSDTFARVPQHLVAAKWKPAALTAFLKNPSKNHRWIRMPNFGLRGREAAALTAFLVSTSKGTLRPLVTSQPADIQRGRELFATSGCADCHDRNPGGIRSRLQSPSLESLFESDWQSGCLQSRSGAADFAWSKADRAALSAFARHPEAADSLGRRTSIATASRLVRSLRCAACHQLDGRASTWAQIKDREKEDGLTPAELGKRMGLAQISERQNIPQMTWFGQKFKPQWMRALLAGQVSAKPRPGLLARMPSFPQHAAWLTTGLAHEHGRDAHDIKKPAADPAAATIGAKLASAQGGFNCISCHAVGNQRATGGDLLETINFRSIPHRLRHDYFARWMLNPQRIDPRTMMPPFAPEGKSPLTEFYGGDGVK
ncbi:MAG: c-type cytochrome, partial [Phycisphaerae bacterium]|nr:c-type cytochrome [Phycisphaerae bacterium]